MQDENDQPVVPLPPEAGEGTVRAVIVSYQAREFLAACLASLGDVPQIGEVVVVDNASTDGTVEWLRRAGFEGPGKILVTNGENTGFAAAANQGASSCTLPLVLLLNCDVEATREAVAALYAALEADPRAAVASARLLTHDGRDQMPFNPQRSRAVRWAPAAFLMMRRAMLDEIGWLDPGFFFYNEDVDLGVRIRRRGWRVLYIAEAKVLHHEGKSTDGIRHQAIVHGYRGGLRLVEKHYPWLLAAARLAIRAEVRARAILYHVLPAQTDKQRAFLAALPELLKL